MILGLIRGFLRRPGSGSVICKTITLPILHPLPDIYKAPCLICSVGSNCTLPRLSGSLCFYMQPKTQCPVFCDDWPLVFLPPVFLCVHKIICIQNSFMCFSLALSLSLSFFFFGQTNLKCIGGITYTYNLLCLP